ncbi:hypothetical protein QMA10_17370 [Arthrobacter sp. APC 3897]|nr:hypothetical protein [Arthrobacter sp. APC 3897]MDN3483680.1 hypothetical protein [Arthrobacter sp. APC 3897]
MKAVDSHLLTLLKASSQFIVPIYQRLYSWQEAEGTAPGFVDSLT